MEEGLHSLVRFEDSIDADDSKYLCGLSTILVANIQELKYRISQIEFIFCSQHSPNFQLRTKSLQKRYMEAKKASNDEWRNRESSLLHQIKELQLENQCAGEEVCRLNTSLDEAKIRWMSSEELVKKYEHEKMQLLIRLENLERSSEVITSLKEQIAQKTDEVAEGKKMQEKLLQQIDMKDHNLLAEQSKRKGLFEEINKLKDSYKQLKSQYNYLRIRSGDGKVSKPQKNETTAEGKSSSSPYIHKKSPPYSEQKDKEIIHLPPRPPEEKVENGNLQENPGSNRGNILFNCRHDNLNIDVKVENDNLGQKKPGSSREIESFKPPQVSMNTRPEPLSRQKRPASYWEETRTRQEAGGVDPHDDFLDTPIERARNLNIAPQENVQDLPVTALNDMDFNNSDDETQEVVHPQNQSISVMGNAAKNGFKFVEPVRKKNERENFEGVECKQCKKFYDAVLPSDGNTSNAGNQNMRCEHHDGISRHRYKYAPLLTPEGFWNIGFDSDL